MKTVEEQPIVAKFPTDFSPPEGVEVYHHRTVINWYWNDIYHIHALSDVEHKLEDAKRQTDLMKELFGDEKVQVLLDIRDIVPMAYDARKHYGTEEGKWNNGSTAVLVKSAFTKAVANFLLGAFRRSVKTKMFLSVDDAVIWLNKNR